MLASACCLRTLGISGSHQRTSVRFPGLAAVLSARFRQPNLQLPEALDRCLFAGLLGNDLQLYAELWSPLRTGLAIWPTKYRQERFCSSCFLCLGSVQEPQDRGSRGIWDFLLSDLWPDRRCGADPGICEWRERECASICASHRSSGESIAYLSHDFSDAVCSRKDPVHNPGPGTSCLHHTGRLGPVRYQYYQRGSASAAERSFQRPAQLQEPLLTASRVRNRACHRERFLRFSQRHLRTHSPAACGHRYQRAACVYNHGPRGQRPACDRPQLEQQTAEPVECGSVRRCSHRPLLRPAIASPNRPILFPGIGSLRGSHPGSKEAL